MKEQYLERLLAELKLSPELKRTLLLRLSAKPTLSAFHFPEIQYSAAWVLHQERLQMLFAQMDAKERNELQQWAAAKASTYEDRITVQNETREVATEPAMSDAAMLTVRPPCSTAPTARLNHLISHSTVDWHSDLRCELKAYIMACFSELAYLFLPEAEFPDDGRYKVFPTSLIFQELLESGIRFDLDFIRTTTDFEIEIIPGDNYVYLITRTRDITVIAVRGTAAVEDWLINFAVAKVDTEHGPFHSGFFDEAKKNLQRLEDVVRDSPLLYVTGHSLGGAVASILATIWRNRNQVRTPYVFASPRVATKHSGLQSSRFNYVRPLDIVPRLPPTAMGYTDSGVRCVIQDGETTRHLAAKLLRKLFRMSIKDHMIEGIRCLLGNSIGEVFPEQAYLSVLLKELKSRYGQP